jgi:hypothetical protein
MMKLRRPRGEELVPRMDEKINAQKVWYENRVQESTWKTYA